MVRNKEAQLLGGMIFNNDAIPGVISKGSPSFRSPANQKVFDAIVSLHQAGQPIDLVTLRDELVRRAHLDDVGGPDYLIGLIEGIESL